MPTTNTRTPLLLFIRRLPKQASLAAALLLFIRGGADGLSAAGALVTGSGAGDFAQSAVLQVGLSIAALVFYLFF